MQQNFLKVHRSQWTCNIFLAVQYQLGNQNIELL